MSARRLVWLTVPVAAALLTEWAWSRPESNPPLFERDFPLALDLDLSPDGRYLAVGGINEAGDGRRLATQVIDLTDGAMVFDVPDGGGQCAWSADGSTLAFSRHDEAAIGLWDFRRRRSAKSVVLRGTYCGSLVFDRHDNLFAVVGWDSNFESRRNQALCWPATGDGKEPTPLEGAGNCRGDEPFSAAASAIGAEVRVAIAYTAFEGAPCATEILRGASDDGGHLAVEIERSLPGVTRAWIQLTPDAKRLVALDPSGLRLFDIDSEPSKQIWKVEVEISSSDEWTADVVRQRLSVSNDGSRVAARYDDRVEVRRLVDGKEVFTLRRPCFAASLGSDGRKLAVIDADARKLCVYAVPEK